MSVLPCWGDALGRDLRADQRFATATQRKANNQALIAVLDEVFAERSHSEWMDRFTQAGLVASPINNLADVIKDEQAWQNNYFQKSYCEEVKRDVEVRGLPVTLSKTPGEIDTLGPQLGQDTELLMMDLLGYEWDEIEAKKAAGAIP